MSIYKIWTFPFLSSLTRAIITRGLYIFYPIFEDHFFVFKEFFFRKFCPYVWLVFKSSLYSRADYDGVRTGDKKNERNISFDTLRYVLFCWRTIRTYLQKWEGRLSPWLVCLWASKNFCPDNIAYWIQGWFYDPYINRNRKSCS